MARRRGRGSAPGPRDNQVRERICQEAARIMAELGIEDFALAKRKAAERVGVSPERRHLPSNEEVEAALVAYQQLFRADTQPQRLRYLRKSAAEAMRLLEPFEPRLVGSVLSGTADDFSPIHLHLFAASPEQVDLFLMERNIPFEHTERNLRVSDEQRERYPGLRFVAGDAVIELVVFPEKGLRQPPLSPVSGRPMERADLARVEALLAADEDSGREA